MAENNDELLAQFQVGLFFTFEVVLRGRSGLICFAKFYIAPFRENLLE